jgi:DNA invertase Pin-like site-specific DNA recombinase
VLDDVLVVAELDRLGLSVADLAALLDRPHREGWGLSPVPRRGAADL